MEEKKRASFSGNLGFVVSAAGAAVGLGNIWKFPHLAGSSGGGIFLIMYIIIAIAFGAPLLLAESTVGRAGQADSAKSFSNIASQIGHKNPKRWSYAGFVGILSAIVIFTYYPVVGGWVIEYLIKSFTTPLSTMDNVAFNAAVAHPFMPLVYTAIFCLINFFIVYRGIESGIEKANKIMLPGLFLFLIIVVVRSVTLPGAIEGVKFFFLPNIENMRNAGGFGKVLLAALGQCFFSMSLGQGIIVTYGSYLKKDTNLMKNAVAVPIMDTFVALLAGLAVLPVVFAYGMEPSAGPGLLFGTLPLLFHNFGTILGPVFSGMFFLLVLFAALTSSMSLLEVISCYLVDTFKWKRKRAIIITAIGGFICCIVCSLSNGVLSGITIAGMNIFDALGWLSDKLLIPLASLMFALFIGYVWKPENALKEITNQGTLTFALFSVWRILIKYILPVGIVVIFITGLIG